MPVIAETPIEEKTFLFEDRCNKDPQGVIDDLVKQTRRQAKAIHEKNIEIERLDLELTLFLRFLKKFCTEAIVAKFEVELKKRKK